MAATRALANWPVFVYGPTEVLAALRKKYPQYAVLADALQAPPKWRPRTDQWNQVETIIGTHLNAALAGSESAQDVVTKASAEIRTLMQGAGYPTQ